VQEPIEEVVMWESCFQLLDVGNRLHERTLTYSLKHKRLWVVRRRVVSHPVISARFKCKSAPSTPFEKNENYFAEQTSIYTVGGLEMSVMRLLIERIRNGGEFNHTNFLRLFSFFLAAKFAKVA
jgi:hypothetical protein